MKYQKFKALRKRHILFFVMLVITQTLLAGHSLRAMPSGLGRLPKDVVIPSIGDRALPVELLPHTDDGRIIYVKPLEGKFVGQGVVKSPLARCDLVKAELEVAETNAKARVEFERMLRQAQLDYAKNSDEYAQITRSYEETAAKLPVYHTSTDQALQRKKDALADLKDTQAKMQENQDLIAIEKDKDKIKALQEKLQSLANDEATQKKAFISASAEVRKAQRLENAVSADLAEYAGQKNGLEKTLVNHFEEIGRIRKEMDDLQEASDKVLKGYSERVGGYTTFTMDFAPADYIQKLKDANPQYQFEYVPSITASVDPTIPGNLRETAPIENRIGTLILDAKWSDAATARSKHPFDRLIIKDIENGEINDPVKTAQSRLARFENSLTGAKFLALKLSILGYCALREPESLASQFNGGAAETFKLALYYTYPVNFELSMDGSYNSYAMLYDFYHFSKSSSWFGLSKKQKQEHMRTYTSSKYMSIDIKPRGVELSPQETLLLSEKIKDQLTFFVFQNYVDLSGHSNHLDYARDPAKPGAELQSIGTRLMMIPNPWTFWSGFTLNALGSMFGSSNQTIIDQNTQNVSMGLHYGLGFTFAMPADLTIGDLKNQKVVDEKAIGN